MHWVLCIALNEIEKRYVACRVCNYLISRQLIDFQIGLQ